MSITTLRPNGVNLDVATTKVPAVAANLNVDDSPVNDATYVTGTTTGSGLRFTLDDITLSGTQRVKQVRHMIRMFHNSIDVGWREYIDARLRNSSNSVSTPVEQHGTTSNTAIDSIGQWYTSAPGGVAWTEALVDGLLSDIAWRASGGGQYLRVSEVYVDVDINTQPAAGTVTVTGATTTTKPTVTWAPSDADGDALTRWRVRVIQQSVTTQPGFDPWTSSAAWDSGIQFGSSTTTTVGTNLLNAVTYVAYAWVAQDWPGPAGPLWWSTASASSNFTIVLTPPGAPVLTATVESTLPDFRVRLAAEETGNLLTANDSEFEATAGTWAGRSNSTAARQTAQFVNGVAGLQQTATAGADAIAGTATGVSGYVCTPGITYSGGFRIRTAVTARSIRAQIEWFTAAGASISVSEGSSVSDATNWTSPGCSVTATAPATARFMALRWRVLTAAAAEVHYIDAAWLRRGTWVAATGSALSAQASSTLRVEKYEPVLYTLNGSPANWISQQIYAPGSLEGDTSGFSKTEATDAIAVENMDRAWPDSNGAGSKMLRWSVRSGTFGLLNISVGTDISDLTYPRYRLPVIPGSPMIGWGYWWSTVQSFAGQWIIQWVDDNNVSLSQSSGGVITVTSTPTLWSVTATPPAGASGAWLIFQNAFSSTFDEVYGCAFGWAQGSAVPTRAGEGVLQPMVFEELRENTTTVLTGQSVRVYDMEMAGGRPAYYRARSEVVVSGQTITSAWSSYAIVNMPVPGTTVLKNPLRPDHAVVLKREPEVDETQSEAAWIAQTQGGDRPIKIRDFLGGKDGAMILNFEDYTECRRTDYLLQEAGTLLLQWFDGGQKYLSVTERGGGIIRSTWGRRKIGYVETGRP